MKNASENIVPPGDMPSRLAVAMREVKNSLADRDDVVVDMREAHRMRLELVATELAPVFAEVPADIDIFDFAISSGLQPRLWIDTVAHVAMGRDRRTYRFVRDTRQGRVVLAESTELKPVTDQVTRYIAERLVERQRMMDAGGEIHAAPPATPAGSEDTQQAQARPRGRRWAALFSGLAFVAAGALAGLALSLVLFWDRIKGMDFPF